MVVLLVPLNTNQRSPSPRFVVPMSHVPRCHDAHEALLRLQWAGHPQGGPETVKDVSAPPSPPPSWSLRQVEGRIPPKKTRPNTEPGRPSQNMALVRMGYSQASPLRFCLSKPSAAKPIEGVGFLSAWWLLSQVGPKPGQLNSLNWG